MLTFGEKLFFVLIVAVFVLAMITLVVTSNVRASRNRECNNICLTLNEDCDYAKRSGDVCRCYTQTHAKELE